MLPRMDPSLENKVAFFQQIDACRNCDDESDTLGIEEQILRRECKAFYAAASATSAFSAASVRSVASSVATPAATSISASVATSALPLPFSGTKLPASRTQRTASDPIFKPQNDELEIIAVTPRDDRSKEATTSSLVHGVPVDGSIIPETEQQPNKKIARQRTDLTTRMLRSQSDLVQSSLPSISMPKRKRTKPLEMAPESEQIFKQFHFFYIPNDDLNPARRMRITKAQEHGATWTRNSAEATHVIVDKGLSYDDIKSFLSKNIFPPSSVLVNDQYPIECLRRRDIFDPNNTVEKYQYKVPGDPTLTGEPVLSRPSTQDSDASQKVKSRRDAQPSTHATPDCTQESSGLVPSSHPEEVQPPKLATKPPKGRAQTPVFLDELTTCINAVLDDPEKHEYLDESDPDTRDSEKEGPSVKKRSLRPRGNDWNANFRQDNFMCMRGGTRDRKPSGPNAGTIKLLEEMVDEHILSDETWRVHSYRKAVATLRRQPKEIKTAKEAAALPNIGKSLAGHIEEIVSTGHFRKLDEIRREPSREALKIFSNIYGVGTPTARRWVELGYRTLDDLRTKAKLSVNQQVGVDRYDDLLTRIPRAEVKALGDHVKDVAAAIDSSVELIIGGSYRRGADTSGDIDLLITKDGTSETQELVPFLDKLVEILTKEEFLTTALASHRSDGGNKWHGCCVLPKAAFPGPKKDYRPIWRRIDFLIVPQTQIGAALIYFTGNDLFNRSMRLLARKKKMKLSHRGLYGPGVDEGKDERKIFEILGVQWREPHERWC
ncbi:hypothetical protein GQX73_g5427 [Xylaria multiplex]|uniref:DNA polymerase lambda n=1 Tax=Xylaria multiplex TaxID=323545 RepID=A0A7C8MLL1_9PEZI|nr:hypothetical protein GQX73_g5427 [Xylaria multiplex]